MRKLFLLLAVVLAGAMPLTAQSKVRPRAAIAQQIQARRLAAHKPALKRQMLRRRTAKIARHQAMLKRRAAIKPARPARPRPHRP
jgi:UDP-3-O-[3-hydroxymyristoyl] glucosamine N-acyltransferase